MTSAWQTPTMGATSTPEQRPDVPRRATPPQTPEVLSGQTAAPAGAKPAAPATPAVPRRPSPKKIRTVADPVLVPVHKVPAGSNAAANRAVPPQASPIVDPVVPAQLLPARSGPPLRRTARISPAGVLPLARIPPEALASPRNDRLLMWAIGISVALHLVVLTIHFRPFDPRHTADKGPPLEVALVNARTVTKPTKADILAQANLDGGGNTDADRRARTPLPVLPKNNPEQQVAVATQQVETLERKTQEMMAQLKSMPKVPTVQKPTEVTEKTDLPSANELMQRTLEAMRLEAQITKDMDTYQKRPKRRFVGARAEEYRFARYVEDWRLKIERIGNLNYPEAARQRQLYGTLLLTVSIKSDGSVEKVELNRTSGSRILDAAAIKIVEMSGPFAPFPSDIRRDTDYLHITRTWSFTKANSLESR